MQLFAGDANALGESRFDIHVNIFEADRPVELALLNFGANGFQAISNLLVFVVTEYADRAQHFRVRERAVDIVMVEALVETDRGGEALDKLIGGL